MQKYITQIKSALNCAVPIIVLRTPDSRATISEIVKAIETPCLHWDINSGVTAFDADDQKAASAAAAINENAEPAMTSANPQEALTRALALMPAPCVLFMENAHLLLETKDESNRLTSIQSVSNCRDPFKGDGRCLILLCADMKVPRELANDVVILDVPLPTETELIEVVKSIHQAAQQAAPDPGTLGRAYDALSGLSRFSAEQVTAMSMRKDGLDFEEMWERKKTIIRQVGGLNVPNEVSGFDRIGGLASIIEYGRDIIAGKHCPRLVVLLDEVEKQMAGLGDSNGINQDCFGQILQGMQDNAWDGLLLPGFPGTGKTEFAKAMGKEAGGLFLSMDLGGTKASLVGESEKMIRAAMQMLLAMGGERVLFVATCNSMAALKPELIRRLSYGTYFFDLPTEVEQAPIWEIYKKKFGIADQDLPQCSGWTGAEIKKVCKLADEFGKPLIEVARRITPVINTMGAGAGALREQAAAGKWLSANTGQPYQSKKKPLTPETARRMVANKGKN